MDWGGDANEVGDDRIEVFPTLDVARERFGENYGGFVFRLTLLQVEELRQGNVVAFDIAGREYAGFLTVDDSDSESEADVPHSESP